MSTSENADLSKLRLKREEHDAAGDLPHRRIWIVVYIACGVFLLLAGLFFYRTLRSEEIVELTTVTMVSPSQVGSILTSSGYIVAQRKAAIASKATGRLVYLGCREGDKVKQGEIIARIESADVEASLAQAVADLEVARAEKNEAERSLSRAKKLIDGQLISQAEYDAAQSRYDRVFASIASKAAAKKVAEVQVENTRIRAPFDGTVLSKNADIGEVVAPFGAGASSRVAVVTIADMSSLEVEADVSESNIERIAPGQPCEIVLDAYPDHRYQGHVDKIVPTADRAKATVLTKIKFVERDSRVLPEMSAKVHFLPKGDTRPASSIARIAVNSAAITKNGSQDIAFVCRDNIVTEMPVELGESMGTFVEVKKGLSVGDKVVLKPSASLTSGARVKLQQ